MDANPDPSVNPMDADPEPKPKTMVDLIHHQFQKYFDAFEKMKEAVNRPMEGVDIEALYRDVDEHLRTPLPEPIDPARIEKVRVGMARLAAKSRDKPNKPPAYDAVPPLVASNDSSRHPRGLLEEDHRAQLAVPGDGYVKRDQSQTYVSGSQRPRYSMSQQAGDVGAEGGLGEAQSHGSGFQGSQYSMSQQAVDVDAEWNLLDERPSRHRSHGTGVRKPRPPMSQQAVDVGAKWELKKERPSGHRSHRTGVRKPRPLMSQLTADVDAEWVTEEEDLSGN
jgi:hypothetical protein